MTIISEPATSFKKSGDNMLAVKLHFILERNKFESVVFNCTLPQFLAFYFYLIFLIYQICNLRLNRFFL